MSLLKRLQKNSKIEETELVTNSKYFTAKDMISTGVPMLNVAFSGSLDGGFTPGVTMWAGPSKHFKTGFALLQAAAYMETYPEAVLLFYDSEFGTPLSYFESFGIDTSRVIHSPIADMESFQFDIIAQLKEIKYNERVMILVDSVGNLASNKEIDDSLAEKSTADMTRAKKLKSIFRMVTPQLMIKNIPMVVVNHTYKTLEMYSKDVVGGGCVIKGTKIIMANGDIKNIEDVTPGELVKTMSGDKPITHVWNPETLLNGTPECYEVEFEDGYTVVCSDIHRFYKDGVWTPISELKIGDDLS